MALRREESERVNNQASEIINKELGQATRRANPFSLVKNLNDAEQKGSVSNATNSNDLKSAEESTTSQTGGEWENKFTGNTKNNQAKGSPLFKFLNRKGPLAIILSLILGSGIGISMLFAPSLLLVQFKEIMADKFNYQFTVTDIRTSKIWIKKMGITSGYCGSKITIGCKLSTLSKKQADNLEKAGIKIIADEKTSLLGRIKPQSMEFEGKIIQAKNLASAMTENPNLIAALRKGYPTKLAGFSDKIWKSVANRLRLSKAPRTFEGDSFEEKFSNLEKDVTETTKLKRTGHLTENDIDPATGEKFKSPDDPNLEIANNKIDEFNTLVEEAGIVEGTASAKLLRGVDMAYSAVKVTGVADTLCSVYRTYRAVGYAAKAVRGAQLAYFAMLFLNVADQIKAGIAQPEDVSFLGDILTKTSKDDFDQDKSATDSSGYRYAAYGDVGNLSTSAMQFMTAAGLAGTMIKLTDNFPIGIKTTCKVLGNPFVGFISFVGGVVLAVASGGTANLALTAAKAALKSPKAWIAGGATLGLALGEIFLPTLLKDIVAGHLVDEGTIGANAGDAITSGSSFLMGSVAKAGGNAPLTPQQAVAYNTLSNNIAAKYAKEDRLSYSPFDASNPNTFLGSIVKQLIPYTSRMSSISGIISSVASISLDPLASFGINNTKAASVTDYTQCQDSEYRNINIATDPFCNVVYGIPTEYIDIDPLEVTEKLTDQVDQETGLAKPDSKYAKFLAVCVNRSDPLGDDSNMSSGEECILDDNTDPDYKYYYLYYIDQRIENGMDEF